MSFTAPSDLAILQDEFISYQLLEKNNIPEEVWESALVGGNGSESSHHRMYVIWNHLSKMKYADDSLQSGFVGAGNPLFECTRRASVQSYHQKQDRFMAKPEA